LQVTVSAEGGAQIEISGEPTAVYRFYDRDCTLLYVGISSNLGTRWASHATVKTWWKLVATRTVAMYGSRDEAEEAEKVAIRTENPVHNVVGRKEPTPKPKPKPPARKAPLTFQERFDAIRRAQSLRETFVFHESFLDKIDAYAEAHEHDRYMALCILLVIGLGKAEEEDAEHEAQMAALRAEIAELEAHGVPLGADVPPVRA
jgi:GIY-YIG catalytic domain